MSNKKIVILSASTSLSHIRLVNALKVRAKYISSDVDVIHIDALKYVSAFYRKKYIETHLELIKKHPALWGYAYDKIDHVKCCPKMPDIKFAFLDGFTFGLRKKIKEIEPDAIIATHFLPAEQINRHKNEKLAKCYAAVIGDYDVHWLWIQKNMDMFFVANKESELRLVSRGVKKEKVKVTGIPINFGFEGRTKDKQNDLLVKHGLKPDKFTIILSSMGYGLGDEADIVNEIFAYFGDKVQIMASAWNDLTLHEKLLYLEENKYKGLLKVMNVSARFDKILGCGDIAVIKAAGISTSGCMALGIPVIVINPMPGDEERNADYLVEKGVAYKVYDQLGLNYKINRLMDDTELYSIMRKNALKAAKPNAATDIINSVLEVI